MKNKKIIITVGLILGIVAIYFIIGEYNDYAKKKKIQDRIDYLEAEIDKIDNGDYSSINESKWDVLSNLELSNFSANSDGTYVNAYGSITNNSSDYIDEILNIAFFDENGGIIRVKAIMVEISPNSTMHFEELIGLTRDGTSIPKSAELTN